MLRVVVVGVRVRSAIAISDQLPDPDHPPALLRTDAAYSVRCTLF